jgi:hypothetical protein
VQPLTAREPSSRPLVDLSRSRLSAGSFGGQILQSRASFAGAAAGLQDLTRFSATDDASTEEVSSSAFLPLRLTANVLKRLPRAVRLSICIHIVQGRVEIGTERVNRNS